jgi:RHS repeat-associated protein
LFNNRICFFKRLFSTALSGKERDAESGNDYYFGARCYSSSMGRFISPDWSAKPEDVPYSSLSDPQSLNLYGYVRNNPLSHRDVDGHQCTTTSSVSYSIDANGEHAHRIGGSFRAPGAG